MTQANPGQQSEPLESEPLLEFLTRREFQVAALIALALTDRQIADSLFISLPTVKGHIGNIRSKLNLKSRTAICRWMLVTHYEKKTILFDRVL